MLKIFYFFLFINVCLANASTVNKITGKVGDKITAKVVSHLQITPSEFRIVMDKGAGVEISKEAASGLPVLILKNGTLRVRVLKSANVQKIEGDSISFTTKEAEFELSKQGESFGLQVIKGEVEVASPLIQTLVSEIVKGSEALRFNKKDQTFTRTKFAPSFSKAPEFDDKN